MLLPPPAQPALRSQVDALNQRAHQLRHSDARQALALCRQAHAMALQLDYQRGLAYSLLRRSLCLSILGDDSEDAPALLQQAASLLRGLGDAAGEAEAVNHQGNLHRDHHDHEAALACYQHAVALRHALGDRAGEAASLNNVALVYRDTGQLADALEQLYRSRQLAEAAGDARATAYALTNLGVLLDQVGEQPQAQAHLDQALVLVRQTADRALECTVLTSLGRLLTDAGQPLQALAHLRTAFDLAQGTGNQGDQALALLALGLVQQALGEHDAAAPLLADALALAHRRGQRALAAQVLLAQARTPLVRGAPAQALPLLQQALDHAEAAQAEPLVAAAHERLSQAHEAAGDLAAALRHFRACHASTQRQHDQPTQRRLRLLISGQALARAELDAQAERARSAELARALADARRAEQDRAQLLAELQAQAALLQQLAREDGLTGVANRRWLDLQLQREAERARRFHHPLAVAMVDIDHFKAVNDRLSHAAGDAALRAVARLLRDGCRASDVVGRYGGEEFLLILVETPADQARQLCDKLRQRIAAHDWAALVPGLGPLTVSIGVAGHAADQPADDLLAQADRALYRAKHGGRNRVCGGLPGD